MYAREACEQVSFSEQRHSPIDDFRLREADGGAGAGDESILVSSARG